MSTQPDNILPATHRTRVLVCDPDNAARAAIVSILSDAQCAAEDTPSTDHIVSLADQNDYDVILIAAPKDDPNPAFHTAQAHANTHNPARVVILTDSLDPRTAIDAMRHGAIDLLVKPLVPTELIERVRAAAEQAETIRRQTRRLDRLKRVCDRLNEDRQDSQSASALETAALAARDQQSLSKLAHKLGAMTIADDLSSRIRAELDVETILRTLLEHVLHTLGPTNAAIFMPIGEDEWSLGAYINYDVDKDSADIVLDRLADYIPHRIAQEPDIVRINEHADLAEQLGEEASWLQGSDIAITACNDEERCLAVLMLFRSAGKPFPDSLHNHLELMRDLMTEQLARIVRVHTRATTSAPWQGFQIGDDAEPPTDDWGLAA